LLAQATHLPAVCATSRAPLPPKSTAVDHVAPHPQTGTHLSSGLGLWARYFMPWRDNVDRKRERALAELGLQE